MSNEVNEIRLTCDAESHGKYLLDTLKIDNSGNWRGHTGSRRKDLYPVLPHGKQGARENTLHTGPDGREALLLVEDIGTALSRNAPMRTNLDVSCTSCGDSIRFADPTEFYEILDKFVAAGETEVPLTLVRAARGRRAAE